MARKSMTTHRDSEVVFLHSSMYGDVFPSRGFSLYCQPNGEPCKRTKATHPYNYDPILLWGPVGENVGDSGAYTDRLYQWDSEKFDRLVKKHLRRASGPGWSGVSEEEATNFLREYNGDPGLKAVRLVESCNFASGYPVWSINWNHGKEFAARLKAQEEVREHARTIDRMVRGHEEALRLGDPAVQQLKKEINALTALQRQANDFAVLLTRMIDEQMAAWLQKIEKQQPAVGVDAE